MRAQGRGGRNTQGKRGISEADLHGELEKQVQERKFLKLEAQLKEAKAVREGEVFVRMVEFLLGRWNFRGTLQRINFTI